MATRRPAASYLASHDVESAIAAAVAAAVRERPADPIAFIGQYLKHAPAATTTKAAVTEYTAADAAWLRERQQSKMLDARVRITGVAARYGDDHHPAVLECYPLRVTGQASASEAVHEGKRDVRGGSSRKWMADAPVPWPNLYWLVEPTLAQRVGTLEHRGLVQQWQQLVKDDAGFAAELAAAHAAYGAARWSKLSDEDREYCTTRDGFASALRDTGVGGLRFVSQVKCLHTHLAHTLAGGVNPVGAKVLEALRRNEDREAGDTAHGGTAMGHSTAGAEARGVIK